MLKLQSYFTGFGSKTDGSASLRFATQEIPSEVFKELKDNLNSFGYLIFSPNPISTADLPTEQAEDTSKTPSKRLRAVLFVKWKQLGSKGDFEGYYREAVEKIITYLKSGLDQ